MIRLPLLAAEGHDKFLGTKPHLSQLCPPLDLGDHSSFEGSVFNAGEVINQQRKKEQ